MAAGIKLFIYSTRFYPLELHLMPLLSAVSFLIRLLLDGGEFL
jgi:hypothetical protein